MLRDTDYRDTTGRHFSWTTFDHTLLETIALINPSRILDIGAGNGKYGALIRMQNFDPEPELTALEVSNECHDQLAKYYDNIDIAIASDLFERPGDTYDTIILGDVIEHFKYSDGLDFIQYCLYRSAYILIITPEAMPQSFEDSFYESHNSIWRPESFRGVDHFLHSRVSLMHFYVLRGYLPGSGTTLLDIQRHINAIGLRADLDSPLRSMPITVELHANYSKDDHPEGSGFLVYRPL